MIYTTSYTSSNGQPSNNERTHETLVEALEAWQSNMGALILCSGGKSTLVDNEDGATLLWVEHCEGGYVTATGLGWEDEVSHLARLAEEDGEALTAERVARSLAR